MVEVKGRRDSDNLQRLERLKPLFETLKADKIRTEAELARSEQDITKAKAEAMQSFGTSDIDKIRMLVDERWAANTADVDRFEAELTAISEEIKGLPRS